MSAVRNYLITPDNQFTVRNLQLMMGRGELDTVANRECLLLLAIHRDAHLSARVIGRFTSVHAEHGELIVVRFDALYARVFALLNASLPRTARVAQNVVDFVLLRPGTICAGHFLARHQRSYGALVSAHLTVRLQFCMDAPIDLRA